MDKTFNQRINNITGQLSGVSKMMAEESPDCFKVITQLKAIKSAVSALMEKYMESEFECCLSRNQPAEREQLKKIFSEIAKK
ncbi:MAG: metal-sensitive transcriptional regulator [Patescibacteria group bacterium]|jgi:DNA-binding FrmR family transcriptional regulator